NMNAFEINHAQNIEINNCEIHYSGNNAIDASNTDELTIQNSFIDYSNNIAYNGVSTSHTTIKNNNIQHTGIFPGMGKGGSGSYEAIIINGDNNKIELNKIDSTGYIPITFSGSSITIKKNFITNFAFVKDDGGGIYFWNNSSNPPLYTGITISHNIV